MKMLRIHPLTFHFVQGIIRYSPVTSPKPKTGAVVMENMDVVSGSYQNWVTCS